MRAFFAHFFFRWLHTIGDAVQNTYSNVWLVAKKKKSSSEFNVSSHLTDKGNNVFVVWTFAWVYTQKIDINELSEGLFIANVNGLKWRKIGSERNSTVCRRTRTCGLGQRGQNIQCLFGHKYVVQISYRIIRLCFISQFFLICDMFLFVC